ncbi:sigma factor-like helix-turn-helix DNA-binding protein [Pseudonocardia ailaonensis]|uniref:Sigma factor-like helix-turn-helix DNA-binding protein n=1 Tax=Pseudonocardia ailaonensis TaxID=367279 RepID=A0ABN2MX63_9PSEU
MSARVDDLLRECAPQVLGALVRRHRQFDLCEDAVQEALLAAAQQWPGEGVPQNPHGWLVAVAHRRVIDAIRSESASRAREERLALLEPPPADTPDTDDTLQLLALCCHPALSPPSQLALTLRAVGGLTTAEIASAFLVPGATMAQRISRAKKTLRDKDFDTPGDLTVVRHVLYLIFNEGYTASSGSDLARPDLTAEAIRLTRLLHRLRPDDDETVALLALMLLTDSRRPARTDAGGELVPLVEQDRTRWDAVQIAEGTALAERAIARGPLGPYELQAAIAAVHADAKTAADTDWRQIVGLYELLDKIAPSPVVTLNRAVAVAELRGPEAGLELLDGLELDGHRLAAVRAHLLERADRTAEARAAYLDAAARTGSLPERRYLERRAAVITPSA